MTRGKARHEGEGYVCTGNDALLARQKQRDQRGECTAWVYASNDVLHASLKQAGQRGLPERLQR